MKIIFVPLSDVKVFIVLTKGLFNSLISKKFYYSLSKISKSPHFSYSPENLQSSTTTHKPPQCNHLCKVPLPSSLHWKQHVSCTGVLQHGEKMYLTIFELKQNMFQCSGNLSDPLRGITNVQGMSCF